MAATWRLFCSGGALIYRMDPVFVGSDYFRRPVCVVQRQSRKREALVAASFFCNTGRLLSVLISLIARPMKN
jgi:mRNA-degrading endonuclease toxin of MazEF toxin-antitoxin module